MSLIHTSKGRNALDAGKRNELSGNTLMPLKREGNIDAKRQYFHLTAYPRVTLNAKCYLFVGSPRIAADQCFLLTVGG